MTNKINKIKSKKIQTKPKNPKSKTAKTKLLNRGSKNSAKGLQKTIVGLKLEPIINKPKNNLNQKAQKKQKTK